MNSEVAGRTGAQTDIQLPLLRQMFTQCESIQEKSPQLLPICVLERAESGQQDSAGPREE